MKLSIALLAAPALAFTAPRHASTSVARYAMDSAAVDAKIDALAASQKSGRAFVRPSGTEDVVRVYAEAATRRDADALALEVRRAVFDLAGGLGERP